MDIKFVREQFPALKSGFVFMDNAGGSQILGRSVNYISDYLINSNVQLGASYKISALAGERLNKVAGQVARFVNAKDQKEIVIGPTSTMLLRILSLCVSDAWKERDEVIVTNTDHEANVSCWTDLEKKGIQIKIWKVNPENFELELSELEKLLSNRTKLVAVTHCSNVLGSINPIKKIAKIVRDAGALICVDGVAYAPHRKIDVQELDVDFYTFSWYKAYGPHLAMMYGKLELLIGMKGLNHYFFKPEDVPYKFQPGNYNFELTYGLRAIPEYLGEFYDHHFGLQNTSEEEKYKESFKRIEAYEEKLAKKLLNYLNSVKEIKIIGQTTGSGLKRVPTISFIHENFKSSEIVSQTDKANIGIRFGDFYAKKLIHDLDLEKKDGVVRVSLVHYNTAEEVEKLIQVFKEIF
ncbi:cysteine desulfurase-like protein [Gillisia limnaea]|uniref:Aminotransferase class V n=1 Tax=Gillisia limnaea (strain DSM 15749 / LMG 21470 / R-8282) TaxID=865937 RepID=H2BVH1_GILLR|nr:cysteine desulfurase-like protein [Gillisia limnaea]EHQ02879.1 aminotransferase class V [Gillisia limnaea DSM 15749]